ncbi:putative Zn-dependent peptidase [Bradyrhizobium ottawaense]
MSVEISKLASGLTVVTDKMPHLETAALGVWAGVGGRDEKPNEHGISHLLEHMAFKGTTKRSSREIVEEIEAVGGDLNAGTSTETTSYYARVLKADVPLALDVLADILANPAFEPDELEREKNVIVQEIGAAQDTPDDVVFEHLNELCYPDQPMGRSLLGTAKTLRAFNRDSLRDYLSTHYRGPDMVVAAAGAVDHKQVVAEVEKRFASFEATPGPKPQAAMFGKGGAKVVHRELEQAHLTLALEGVPQSDLSLFSLQVFTNILGGGMSSRLFQEVREKRGLCYSIYSFHAPYTDTGFFGLYTGTDPADAPEMMEVVVDIMNDSVETLTEAEIARAKAQMKAGPPDGAGELLFPRRAAGAPRAGLWPAADGRGAGGPDRRRQRRIDPGCRACAAVAEPACRCRIRQWQGSGHGGVFCGRIDAGTCQGAAALGAARGLSCPGKHHHGPLSPAVQWTRRPRAAR